MENELSALGGRIKEIRQDKGLSIRDVAELAGINKSQIVRIESGQSDPHLFDAAPARTGAGGKAWGF